MMRKRTLQIDKGISPPVKNIFADTWRSMKPGDSVFFEEIGEAQRFTQALYQATKETKYRQLLRKVDGGWRVWKVRREDEGKYQ